MNIGTLLIDIDYPPELDDKNKCLACFVISKVDKRVLHTAIVDKGALLKWYRAKTSQFGTEQCEYVMGGISLIGLIVSMQAIKDDERQFHDKHSN